MSCGGHEPIGDPGDDFEVVFLHDGEEETYGWAPTQAAAERMADQVRANPHWSRPRVIDRRGAALLV